jgi:hypothetical protein
MQEIESPIRPGDLIHSRTAALARAEEVLAIDRLELARVRPLFDGFLIQTRPSPRFTEWAKTLPVTRHLWLDSAEQDPFATTTLLSHEFRSDSDANPFHKHLDSPLGAWTIVCPWYRATEAVAYLRREVLGPPLLATYGASDLFSRTVAEIIKDLALSEGSFNSAARPQYCRAEGEEIIIRSDWSNAPRILDYFNVESSLDHTLPTVITVGGLIDIVWAEAQWEVRLAICPTHCTPRAIDTLSRWLRQTESTARSDNLLPA